MIHLLLCALTNVGILLCFRLFKSFNLNTFQAIVINYVTCIITGLLFLDDVSIITTVNTGVTWVWIAISLGGVFIMTFYLMALTTQEFSMTVSSIATKMSLMIPVLVSLLFLKVQSKEYTLLNYAGMAFSFPAIIFSSLKKKALVKSPFSMKALMLPLAVFIFGGLIDSVINYTNYFYLDATTEPIFPIIVFTSAAFVGSVIIIIKRYRITIQDVIGGVVLGVVNYFSIYFLLKALSAFNNDGAVLYPLLNVLIIVMSTVTSILIFRERLSHLNIFGLLLAMIALICISYQELNFLIGW